MARTARGRTALGRTLPRLAAWAVATALAMTVSWFGVHRVLAADTAGDAQRAIPITSRATQTVPPGPVEPTPAPPAAALPSPTSPAPTSTPPSARPPTTPTTTTAAPDVRSVDLTGGHIVLELTATSARLVSATPDSGWKVAAWQAAGWLRVDFSRDATTSSCFVTWNGHPPTIQTT